MLIRTQRQEKIASLETSLDEKNALIEERNKTLEQKNDDILQLEEALKQQRQKYFGASSEKASTYQLGLFNEAENLEQADTPEDNPATPVAAHTRQQKPRVSIPDDLPRENIVYDLANGVRKNSVI